MPVTDTELLQHRDGHVVGLTLNRPKKRNALSTSLAGTLRRTLTELADDPGVRAVVILGAGPTWCAGVDLQALQSDDPLEVAASDDPGLVNMLRTMPQPCIAAIHGGCITGGLELALSCDIRIASPDAFFVDTHTRLGVTPVWGMTELLVRAVGDARAREMSFAGNRVDAATALEIGLVSRVVPADQLATVAYRLAGQIAENDPRAVQAVKRMYAREPAVRSALDQEQATMHELGDPPVSPQTSQPSDAG
jgi:enoyl-CoA hydratase/carnithine racemase